MEKPIYPFYDTEDLKSGVVSHGACLCGNCGFTFSEGTFNVESSGEEYSAKILQIRPLIEKHNPGDSCKEGDIDFTGNSKLEIAFTNEKSVDSMISVLTELKKQFSNNI